MDDNNSLFGSLDLMTIVSGTCCHQNGNKFGLQVWSDNLCQVYFVHLRGQFLEQTGGFIGVAVVIFI